MKSTVLLICAVASLQCYTVGHPSDLSQNGIIGVISRDKLQDYLIKAVEGFRKMMPQGDAQLDYPIMDPYNVEDASWDLLDKSDSKKYSLDFITANSTVIKGLSNFELGSLRIDDKDLIIYFYLTFKNLQIEIPYKLEGYMLKNIMPVWGEGIVKLSSPIQSITGFIDLRIDQSYIVIDEASALRMGYDIDIQATGLMDLPEPFANAVLDDIMQKVMKKHSEKAVEDYISDLVEEAVGGMTTNELFEYLDHFVKKSEQK